MLLETSADQVRNESLTMEQNHSIAVFLITFHITVSNCALEYSFCCLS